MQKRASDQLISENRELNSYKRSVLILEQEKRELETKLNTYRESSPGMIFDFWVRVGLKTVKPLLMMINDRYKALQFRGHLRDVAG